MTDNETSLLEKAATELESMRKPKHTPPPSSCDDSSLSSSDEDIIAHQKSTSKSISSSQHTAQNILCRTTASNLLEDDFMPLVTFPPDCFKLLKTLPGNNCCIDCHNPHPEWAVINYGILVCLNCSGRHRSYGVHVSFYFRTFWRLK